MKKYLTGALLLFTFTLFILGSQTGCKKENITNVIRTDTVYKCTPTIQGLWAGTQVNASSSQPYTMSVRTDGTMSYENTISGTQQLCVGTWTLTGATFTFNTVCVYGLAGNVGVRQTFTAVYNSTTGTLTNGTYVNLAPSSGSGTFTAIEVN